MTDTDTITNIRDFYLLRNSNPTRSPSDDAYALRCKVVAFTGFFSRRETHGTHDRYLCICVYVYKYIYAKL